MIVRLTCCMFLFLTDYLPAVVILWRLYIKFELGIRRPTLAKSIFFRAVHRCPWSKTLWIDGLTILRRFMTTEELRDVFDLLSAKEIYVRQESPEEL